MPQRYVTGNKEAIIDLVVWEQVQADTDGRQNLSVRNRTLFAARLAEAGNTIVDEAEVGVDAGITVRFKDEVAS